MRLVLFLAPALLAASPAFAQQQAPVPPDTGAAATAVADDEFNRETITVGAGGAYLPDYEGSNDYRFTAAPAAVGSFRGFNFTLAGNRLSVDLIPDGSGQTLDFQAGPVAVFNFNRTSLGNIDDRRVRALGELDTAIELGGYIGVGKTGIITSPYDRLSVSLSYRHDVTDTHDSGIWQPTVNYLTPLSRKAAVALFASAERAGRGYARTYFSVTPAGSLASGLPTYNARAGWKNYTLGAIGTYSLTGDLLHGFKVVAGGTYGRLLNDFGDSPIVSVAGRRSQWLGAVGLAYTF
jgi:outer membrane protein